MSKQPKISLVKNRNDWVVEVFAYAAVISLIIMPLMAYSSLPEKIPSHFDFSGAVDGFGSKNTIWILPFVGLMVFAMLTVATRYPHHFNYPMTITTENALTQYTRAVKFIRILKVFILCAFVYITWSVIEVAKGHSDGLGQFFVIGFLIITMGGSWFFCYKGATTR